MRFSKRFYQQIGNLPPNTPAKSSKHSAIGELPYFKRIYDASDAIRQAIDLLQATADRFRFIDIVHVEQIAIAAEAIPNNPLKDLDANTAQRRLAETMRYLAALYAAIQLGTGILHVPRGRGRAADKHLLAALELADLWEELSGKPVVTPRSPERGRKDQGEFAQPSSEFIRLTLGIIDPEVTNSQVVTAIRSAMGLQKELAGKRFNEIVERILSPN